MGSMVDEARLDYTRQARGYDETRGASPSIMRPLLAALAGAPGTRLADIGGGTGNYAAALREAGFEPTVLDVSHAMLERAKTKGLNTVRGDARRLPFATKSLDVAVMVSMLHLVPRWREALAEAKRVLRPGGMLALKIYTAENFDALWILDYFPGTREMWLPEHQTIEEILSELPSATLRAYQFADLVDASMAALSRHPPALLDPRYRANNSFFERLERDDPQILRQGLARLEHDLANGRRPELEPNPARERYGDGIVFAWTAP
jgi:ubiquinone/menaquinone biosynthesis C-methylase UbiE